MTTNKEAKQLKRGSQEAYHQALVFCLMLLNDEQQDLLCFDLFARSINKENIQERIKNYVDE